MAHCYRLIALFLLLFACQAHASFPASTAPRFGMQGGGLTTDGQAACESYSTPTYYFNNGCYTGPNGTGAKSRSLSIVNTAFCPANATLGGSTCTCNTGYADGSGSAANTCVAVQPSTACSSLAGKEAGAKQFDRGPTGPLDASGWPTTQPTGSAEYYYCDSWNDQGQGKCVVVVKDVVTTPSGGRWIGVGTGYYTGGQASTCTGAGGNGSTDAAPSTPKTPDGTPPAAPDPGTAAPSPCPAGQAPGTVNGTSVCAPTGGDAPALSTDSTTKKNPDGSTTTTTDQNKCVNGQCTTDSTTCNTPAGSTTASCSTTTTTQSVGTKCAANPGSNACAGSGDGGGSSFTGDCASGFKPVGDDAVLNAMALEQHKRNCQLLGTTNDDTAWVNAERTRTDDRTTSNPNNVNVTLSAGDIDTSDAFGVSAQCIGDKAVTVAGFSVVLQLSKVCPHVEMLGLVLLGVSLVAGAAIVFKG